MAWTSPSTAVAGAIATAAYANTDIRDNSAYLKLAVIGDAEIAPTPGSSQNDWEPTGISTANVIRCTPSTGINITGIVMPTARILVLVNTHATNQITLTHEDASSSAANRLIVPDGANYPLQGGGYATMLWYDTTASRGRVWPFTT